MKQKLLKKSAIVAVLLFCAIPAFSQNIIYNPLKDSEFSIIRNYSDNIDITYNVFESKTSFNYINRGSLSEISAEITENITVHDFVVFDDSVFFCGYTSGSIYGYCAVYGFFDIHDVFFNNGFIYFGLINIPFIQIPNYSQILQLRKLDVMRTLAGETHMLMVGEGQAYDQNIYVNGSHFFQPGVIVDLTINASGNDNAAYHINNCYSYFFDDVAVTENYAIVSAHSVPDSNMTCSHNIFYYMIPTNISESIFTSWIPTGYTAQVPFLQADPLTLTLPHYDVVLVTKIKNDSFATLCHRYNSNGNDYLTLSEYSSPLIQPNYRVMFPYDEICQEMVYNSKHDYLYILAGWGYIFSTQSPYYSTDKIETPIVDHIMSIDNADNEKFEILSGYVAPATMGKKLWRYDELNHYNATCINYMTNINLDLTKTDNDSTALQNIGFRSVQKIDFSPVITHKKISIICTD